MTPAPKKPLPFPFVLELLAPADPVVRPMFGCYALYVAGKITLILRMRKTYPEMNGVWVATTTEHHASLRKKVPALRSIPHLGKGETRWQMVAEADEEFEPSVLTLCDLVLARDRRIGTLPKARAKRTARPAAR